VAHHVAHHLTTFDGDQRDEKLISPSQRIHQVRLGFPPKGLFSDKPDSVTVFWPLKSYDTY
jgi:hypothetical protein